MKLCISYNCLVLIPKGSNPRCWYIARGNLDIVAWWIAFEEMATGVSL